MDRSGKNEPFDGFAKYPGCTAFPRQLVLKFTVFLGQLCGDGIETGTYLDSRCRLRIFAHISIVTYENGLLDHPAFQVAMRINELLHALRHTAYDKILLIKIQGQRMDRCGHALVGCVVGTDTFREHVVSRCPEKFLKVHWEKAQFINFTHRIRKLFFFIVNRNTLLRVFFYGLVTTVHGNT